MPRREIISASASGRFGDFGHEGLQAPRYRRTRQLVHVQVHNPSLVGVIPESREELLSVRFITGIKWRTYNKNNEVTSK